MERVSGQSESIHLPADGQDLAMALGRRHRAIVPARIQFLAEWSSRIAKFRQSYRSLSPFE